MAQRKYKQEKAIKERTAAGKKKNKDDEVISENQKFIMLMIKYLNSSAWLKKYLNDDAGAVKKLIEICQSLAHVLKQYTHAIIRKQEALEFESAYNADVQLFERNVPFTSNDIGTKLSMYHQ